MSDEKDVSVVFRTSQPDEAPAIPYLGAGLGYYDPGIGGMGTKLGQQLSNGGNLVGKRAMALLVKSGLFPRKALSSLMRIIEKEGMVVTMGEIVANDGESAAAARGAPLIRG